MWVTYTQLCSCMKKAKENWIGEQCSEIEENLRKNNRIRKKYFEEKSLYSLFRNVIPEVVFDFLREIGVFYKV